MEHVAVALDVQHSHISDLLELWTIGGQFCQDKWTLLLQSTTSSPLLLYVYGTFLLTTIEYWLLCLVYFFLDTSECTFFLRKRYKILDNPSATSASPYKDKQRLLKVARNVLINQTVISIPIGYLTYYLATIRGHSPVEQLPSCSRIIFDLMMLIGCEEIGFYYVHRALHHRVFYNRFHRVHHEWQVPIAMAAIYCHPVEHLFCNLLPIFGGFLLLGSHVLTCWLWIASVYFVVLNDHSGYHFPFFFSSEAHDFHHRRSTTFFGVFGYLDRLHGTDTVWRKSKVYSTRHKIILSFQSLKRE